LLRASDFRLKATRLHRARALLREACGPTPRAGFYHDGRFPTLRAVVEHYNSFFHLGLTDREQRDLVEYLKSL
jgi:cytochrome c peroxidase